MRHPREVDLSLTIDRSSARPLPTQIAAGIRQALETGALRPGDALPSTRAWAQRLEVSRGTVVSAFDQLHGEGWLISDRGATRIDPSLSRHQLITAAALGADHTATLARPTPRASRSPHRIIADLRPGVPDTASLVDGSWRAAWRSASAAAGARHPTQGSPGLRAALAEHLRRTRGTVAEPGELLITAGVRDGLQLLLTALSLAAARPLRLAVEDPGFPALRRVITGLGHTITPITTDTEGIRVDHLQALSQAPDLVLLTPGHQYPLGGAIPMARRLDLIAWARQQNALLIEDDYDSELRFRGPPVSALAALDRQVIPGGDRVVLLGSFAKLLSPGIGVGHLLAPPATRRRVHDLRADLGNPVPAVVQEALTHYLDGGGLRRHVARMRRHYRTQRDLAADAFAGLPRATLRPMDGGLHGVINIAGLDHQGETRIRGRAERAGVLVAGLADYWAEQTPEGSVDPVEGAHGLVIGLGSPDLARGLAELRDLLSRS